MESFVRIYSEPLSVEDARPLSDSLSERDRQHKRRNVLAARMYRLEAFLQRIGMDMRDGGYLEAAFAVRAHNITTHGGHWFSLPVRSILPSIIE